MSTLAAAHQEPEVVPAPRTSRVSPLVRHRLAVAGAIVAVTVAVVLHLGAALSAQVPIWSDDEIGPLATSRLISGVGEPLALNHFSYYPGWPVVLAPLWWFLHDPGTVYRAAVLMSGLAACLTILPLAAIARRMSVSRPVAVLLAAVVMAGPARVVLSDYAVTEAFFALVVVTTVWLGVRYTETGSWGSAVLLSLSAAYTFFTHGRGLVLPIAVALLLVARARRRSWPVSALGLVTLVAATAALFTLHKSIAATLYPPGEDREDAAVGAVLHGLTGPLLDAMSGQTWYALVAWVGLPAFGVSALVLGLRREWVARLPGRAAWIALVTLGALGTGMLATSNALSAPLGRLDVIVYGRYIDPFLLPLVVVGLAAVARGLPRLRGLVAWAATAVLLGLFVWLVAPLAEPGGLWFAMNIAGLLLWEWPAHHSDAAPPFAIASVVTLLVGAFVVLVGRQLRWVSVALIGAMLLLATWTAQTQVAWPWNRATETVPGSLAVLDEVDDLLGEQVDVAYYTRGAAYTGQNFTQFWLIPRQVRVIDSLAEATSDEVVIARRSWFAAERAGARRLIGLAPDEDALWVLPGALADRLGALGHLEPVPGAPLADPAYALRVVSEVPGAVDQHDDPRDVVVQVVNLGTQTWPVLGNTDDPLGVVRLVATWTQGTMARDVVVDLSEGVFPGGTVRVDVPLEVPGDLRPGEATVTFRLIQESLPPLGDPVNGPTAVELRLR
ncbi:hypothetical protein AGMMS50218_11540 [Actinomycetota bacterium]|nr:hypothetical protein AGMMS50218_11540 [Actinomycetota bacterium]